MCDLPRPRTPQPGSMTLPPDERKWLPADAVNFRPSFNVSCGLVPPTDCPSPPLDQSHHALQGGRGPQEDRQPYLCHLNHGPV